MDIYVGNLKYEVSDEDLKDSFSEYGDVDSAKVIKDRESGRSKGFGFVNMPNNDEAKKAIENLNGQDMMGRALNVSEARPKNPR